MDIGANIRDAITGFMWGAPRSTRIPKNNMSVPPAKAREILAKFLREHDMEIAANRLHDAKISAEQWGTMLSIDIVFNSKKALSSFINDIMYGYRTDPDIVPILHVSVNLPKVHVDFEAGKLRPRISL